MTIDKIEFLITENSNEREISNALKKELSILGEYFAPYQIRNEYIAFSEFPIGDSITDFAVFTSRSRMEIVLIEIKGADFDFITKGGEISATANHGIQALRKYIRTIENDIRLFREKFHKIRQDVELGKSQFNSYLGTKNGLHVDAQKDIVIKGAFIGGRTTDDLKESQLRDDIERSDRRLLVESWDSWLRKAKK
jgi:hypothetical protein